ncbi:MAG: hypothetical protein IID52_07640 [Proteobacteria bacterium]|nr:hypothetical protein [Pseudomonadota bacterium]
MKVRKRLHKRFATIEADLKRIERAGGVIKKHCPASSAEIRSAAKKYQAKLEDARKGVFGAEFTARQIKAALRRLEL